MWYETFLDSTAEMKWTHTFRTLSVSAGRTPWLTRRFGCAVCVHFISVQYIAGRIAYPRFCLLWETQSITVICLTAPKGAGSSWLIGCYPTSPAPLRRDPISTLSKTASNLMQIARQILEQDRKPDLLALLSVARSPSKKHC